MFGTEDIVAANKANNDRPAFYIESDVSGYCGLCDVPGVNGTGMASCEVSDQCGGLNVPKAGLRYVPK
jgi:hypothetical protein